MKPDFEKYKDRLFNDLLSGSHHERFMALIEQLHNQGSTKKEIHELFLEFHKAIQIDPRTKEKEVVYDNLSDFMDGFVDHGVGFKILPNESYK
ncbi:hypothetical protein [Gilvibacter sediminis]|uniref:hypothetical protein n=1 Tax=Gilvibacter sediminis TaxID=379071 RepID=UPI002350D36B|nr:hypothetical protein [Gilvibacter sediminis]MDC7997982.1 hypothetical protein [Gilvibacter sediminis]